MTYNYNGPAFIFFYNHAGYSFVPATETADEGRQRCAVDLASAEAWARETGHTFQWSEDWEVGSHRDYYGHGSAYENGEPETCENCDMFDSAGRFVTSLGCVDDATDDYRRVVEAELASEAKSRADELCGMLML